MAKKKAVEDVKPGAPAWTATFSDLMNLLLCFFVLLFSMSSVDAAKYEEVAKSFAETFSVFQGGGNAIGDGVMVSNGVSQLNELSQYFSSMGVSATGRQDNEIDNNSETQEEFTSDGGKEGEQESEDSFSSTGAKESKEVQEAKEELTEAQLKASEELAEKTGFADWTEMPASYAVLWTLISRCARYPGYMNGAASLILQKITTGKYLQGLTPGDQKMFREMNLPEWFETYAQNIFALSSRGECVSLGIRLLEDARLKLREEQERKRRY